MNNSMIISVPRYERLSIMESQADGLAFEMLLNETAVKKQHYQEATKVITTSKYS